MRATTRRSRIAIAILIPAVLAGGFVVSQKVDDHYEKARVSAVISEKRDAAMREQDAAFASRVEMLRSRGIIGERVAQSKVDRCRFDTRDAGWMVESYQQECYVRTVEGYATTLSKAEVYRRVAAQEVSRQLGELNPNTACSVVRGQFTVSMIEAGNPGGCEAPQHRTFAYGAKTREFSSFDANEVGYSQNIVWIETLDTYSEEDLGCVKPVLLFCANPRGSVITADD